MYFASAVAQGLLKGSRAMRCWAGVPAEPRWGCQYGCACVLSPYPAAHHTSGQTSVLSGASASAWESWQAPVSLARGEDQALSPSDAADSLPASALKCYPPVVWLPGTMWVNIYTRSHSHKWCSHQLFFFFFWSWWYLSFPFTPPLAYLENLFLLFLELW